MQNGVFEVKPTNSDTLLGGKDFDIVLINHLVNKFKKESGIDLHSAHMAIQGIREAVEKAKIELSSTMQTEINLPFINAGTFGLKHINAKLLHSQFGEGEARKASPELHDIAIKGQAQSASVTTDAIQEMINETQQASLGLFQKVCPL